LIQLISSSEDTIVISKPTPNETTPNAPEKKSSTPTQHIPPTNQQKTEAKPKSKLEPNPPTPIQITPPSPSSSPIPESNIPPAPPILSPSTETPTTPPKTDTSSTENHPIQNTPETPSTKPNNNISQQWNQLLNIIKDKKPALFTILRNSKATSLENNKLTIAINQSFQFFYEKLNEKTNIDYVNTLINNIFGKPYEFHTDKSPTSIPLSPHTSSTDPPSTNPSKQPTQTAQTETINTIVSMFDGYVL
jgi:hypothetical protein